MQISRFLMSPVLQRHAIIKSHNIATLYLFSN